MESYQRMSCIKNYICQAVSCRGISEEELVRKYVIFFLRIVGCGGVSEEK